MSHSHGMKCVACIICVHLLLVSPVTGTNYNYFPVLDDDWKELEFKTPIPWRWEEIPLQIKTDSVVGSGDGIGIDMRRPHAVSGISIKFSSPIKYWMAYCSTQSGSDGSASYADLPVQPPDEVDKIWTFTKTDSALLITCNGVEVLNYEFAASGFSNCFPKWGGNTTESIEFYKSWNTASDFYRAGPKSCPGFEVENSQGSPWQTTTAGETVTIECLENHLLNGEGILTCQNDGTWSSEAPTCEHVDVTMNDPEVAINTAATFICEITGVSSNPTITWKDSNLDEVTSGVTQPSFTAVSAITSYVIVRTGDTSSFECTGTGNPTSKIEWVVPGSVTIDGSIRHAGNYDDLTSIFPFNSTTPGVGAITVTCYIGYGTDGQTVQAAIRLDVVTVSMSAGQGRMAGEQATFTCSYTAGTVAPVVRFYDSGSEITTVVTEGDAIKTESYTISKSSFGKYYVNCVVIYMEETSKTFGAASVLYVREVTSLPAKTYIHHGEGITLTCVWKLGAPDDTYTNTTWTAGGSVVAETSPTNYNQNSGDRIQMVYEKANADLTKASGDTYKCAVNMTTGDDLEASTEVLIHWIEPLSSNEFEINTQTFTCKYSGSTAPTFTWKVGPTTVSDGSTYGITRDEAWDSANLMENSVFSFKDDLVSIKDVTAIECEITFATNEDKISSQVQLHHRWISAYSQKTYAVGGQIVLSCTMSYGPTGVATTDVIWTGIHDSVKSSKYTIDRGSNTDGERTTTLTFPDTNDINIDSTYTCEFSFYDGPDLDVYKQTIEVIVRLAQSEDKILAREGDAKVDLECTLEGSETQSSATWTTGSTTITAGGDYTITTTEKKTVLSIANPTHDERDGEYTCTFDFENQPNFSPSSVINLDIICK
uniref:Putative secretory peptide-26 n=1 Tax=Pleurobrachia bachei TaxID=34499 RepID=M4H262_PLEBA|nr:putative secretory peptide-26 [Pleurobrachia bachei]|eukprot:sb/3461942/